MKHKDCQNFETFCQTAQKEKENGKNHGWSDMSSDAIISNPGQKGSPRSQCRGLGSQIFCSCCLKFSVEYIKMSAIQMRLLNSFLRIRQKGEVIYYSYVAGFVFYFYFCSSNPQAHSSPSSWILICFCLIWMQTSILPAEMVNSCTHLCHEVVINNNHLWGWREGNSELTESCSNTVLWSFL